MLRIKPFRIVVSCVCAFFVYAMNRDEAISASTAKQANKRRKNFTESINTTSSALVSLVLQLWSMGVISAPIVQSIAAICVAEVLACGETPSQALVSLQKVGTKGAHLN